MAKIIKDYHKAVAQMELKKNFDQVLCRGASCRRIIDRLDRHLNSIDPTSREAVLARCTIKQYYKCYLADQRTMPKIRMDRLIALDFMIGKLIKVYNGKSYLIVKILPQNTGRYLKEFVATRKQGAAGKKVKKVGRF